MFRVHSESWPCDVLVGMQSHLTTPKMLTPVEAAARAGISRRSLDSHIARGTGPDVTRIGRRVLIREDRLAAWIESQTTTAEHASIRDRDRRRAALGLPTIMDRQEAQQRGRGLVGALLRDDYAAAEAIVPLAADNLLALELAGVLVRLLRSDDPAAAVDSLRKAADAA